MQQRRLFYPGRYLASRDKDTIHFAEKVNNKAFRDFMVVVQQSLEVGYEEITLDFSQTSKAYPDGIIPIISYVDTLKHDHNVQFNLALPEQEDVKRLFLNTNWAHLLSPDLYDPSETTHDRHLAAQRFTNFEEQQDVVDRMLDVVMRNTEMERSVIAGLEWSINEITDNVLNHAVSPNGGMIQVTTFVKGRTISFTVADSGIGILKSMQNAFPDLSRDGDAIGEAIKANVTSDRSKGQGNGLAGTLQIAKLSRGRFAVTSGRAQLLVQMHKGEPQMEVHSRRHDQNFHGTVVSAEILIGKFDLSEALGFRDGLSTPMDVIETAYETDDGSALLFQMRDETTGFGTRQSGSQVRTKCLNLLNAEPTKPLIIDWDGVPLISSSFADETIGKLFVELGPTGFSARIQNKRMEDLVRSLIDKAILQRISQSMSDPSPF